MAADVSTTSRLWTVAQELSGKRYSGPFHPDKYPMKNKITYLLYLKKGLAVVAALLGSSITAIGFAATPKQPKPDWSMANIPSQQGRIVLVTGGTSGMGFEDAKALSAAGAQVVIAARNRQRGEETIAKITAAVPHAKVQFEALDLSDFASVRALSKRLKDTLPRLDVLINNAAIMAPPERGQNTEGVELQYATNYAGHFLLTAELLPLLRKSAGARVITVASVAVHRGRLNFEDLQSVRAYDPYAAYAQSKLACLMFAFELQRRSDAANWRIQSLAAHPGIAVPKPSLIRSSIAVATW